MRRPLAPLVVLGLAGCGPAGSGGQDGAPTELASMPAPAAMARATSTASAQATSTPPTPDVNLAGHWRVAAIDGKDLDEPYGLAMAANENEIWWEPRCAGVVRSYVITGATIRFGPAPSRQPPPQAGTPAPPPVVCAIGLHPRLNEVMRALDRAQTIVRTPANGIEIAGGGHSVTLFSQ